MPLDQVIERLLQRTNVERTLEAYRAGDVVSRSTRIHLLEKPQTALCKRARKDEDFFRHVIFDRIHPVKRLLGRLARYKSLDKREIPGMSAGVFTCTSVEKSATVGRSKSC